MNGADHIAVLEAVENIAQGADRRRWDMVRSAFAGRVVLDYGIPELLTPAEIVERWRPFLSAFDRTEHLVHDSKITFLGPDRALVLSSFTATHQIANAPGGDLWVLTGRYEHEVLRTDSCWNVTRMRMIPGESIGNAGLPELARDRAGQHAAEPPSYRVEQARFTVDGVPVVGLLHLPLASAVRERLPGVVVHGSWTTVKE